MKKLIGVIAGCIAAYYVLDVIATVSMACAWRDLIKFGHVQAANELDDTFHKKYCKRNQKVFDLEKKALSEMMERE